MKILELELSAPPLCIRTWHRSPLLPSISAKCVDTSVCCSHHSAAVAAGNVGNLRPMEPKEERENGREEGRGEEIGRREREEEMDGKKGKTIGRRGVKCRKSTRL